MSIRIDELIPMLHGLHDGKFYGSMEIIYKDGEIQFLKKIETIKPTTSIVQIEITASST